MLTSRWSVTPLLWSALEEPFGGTSIISISITISLERNESGSRLTNGEETETGYFLTICITYRTWQRPSGCSSVTRRGLWTLIFPSMSLFRRTSFLLKSEISWEEKKKKKDDPGSDEARHCLVSISRPEMWVNSQRKWHWNCINFSGFGSAGHNSWNKDIRKILDGGNAWAKGSVQQVMNKV